jgi:hypothetical protein
MGYKELQLSNCGLDPDLEVYGGNWKQFNIQMT